MNTILAFTCYVHYTTLNYHKYITTHLHEDDFSLTSGWKPFEQVRYYIRFDPWKGCNTLLTLITDDR